MQNNINENSDFRKIIAKKNQIPARGSYYRIHRILTFIFSLLILGFSNNCSSVNDATDLILFGFTSELTFEDSGTAGITVNSLSGGFCLHENSANGTLALTVVLNSAPKSSVTVPLSTNDAASATCFTNQPHFFT